jgi:DNA-binding PadR family transcriptional regulator
MTLRYILLGLLGRRRSGYELKTDFSQSLRHFWSAPLSQVYPALHALAEEGLASCIQRPSPKGPPRKLYRRTRAGKQELERWLREPPDIPDVRIPYLAQFYFLGQLRDPPATEAFLRTLRASFEERLRRLEGAEESEVLGPGLDDESMTLEELHPYMSLRFGIIRLRSNIEWCDESLERLRRHGQASAGGTVPAEPP